MGVRRTGEFVDYRSMVWPMQGAMLRRKTIGLRAEPARSAKPDRRQPGPCGGRGRGLPRAWAGCSVGWRRRPRCGRQCRRPADKSLARPGSSRIRRGRRRSRYGDGWYDCWSGCVRRRPRRAGPCALTHRSCDRNGTVASPECYPRLKTTSRHASDGPRCPERAGAAETPRTIKPGGEREDRSCIP